MNLNESRVTSQKVYDDKVYITISSLHLPTGMHTVNNGIWYNDINCIYVQYDCGQDYDNLDMWPSLHIQTLSCKRIRRSST